MVFYEGDESAWSDLLVGHRIVKAERDDYDSTDGVFTLDNGTKIRISGNEGCGGCGNGWYYVTHIAEVDNLIMAVRCDVESTGEIYEDSKTYRMFVMTANAEIEALTVDGYDNGYYGEGYTFTILED